MGGESDFDGDGAQAALVIDVERYLASWKQLIAAPHGGARPGTLGSASRELQTRARAFGFGGLAHHLGRVDALVDADGRFPIAELSATLEDVQQLLEQVKEALSPRARAHLQQPPPIAGPAHPAGHAPGEIAPPPLLTAYRSRVSEPAPPPPVQPPPAPLGPRPVSSDTMLSEPSPVLGLDRRGTRDAAGLPVSPLAEPPRLDATAASAPPQYAAPPLEVRAEHARAPAPQAGFAVVQPSPSVGVVGKTLFGLRAFGSGRSKAEPAPGQAPSSVLGLGSVRRTPPAPPPLISAPLPPLHDQPRESAMTDFLRRRSKPDAPKRERRAAPARAARPRRRRSSVSAMSWGFVALGAVGLVATVVVIVLLVTRRSKPDDPLPQASLSGAPLVSGAPARAGVPRPRLTTDEERLQGLLPAVHEQGGKESPELRDVVDEDAALQLKLAQMTSCDGPDALCSEWRKARQLFSMADAGAVPKRRQPSALRSRWLMGLTLPEIGVEDDERVRREFEFHTEHAAGRERFQTMLFRCGSYRDQIQATLARYDLPESLMAVVMAESACIVEAKSPKNALGLWQFIPGAARAYNLRVIEGKVDERLSPAKSSEAAARFLADMYRKFGSWDLVFAGYNCGPFGMATRLHLAGDGAGFWDLVDASLVPEETAGYVPRIQAYALIMKNLSRLKFAGAQMRAPEVTADLDAPPGTRLGLIARAASTSVIQIRRLNRDILGDVVPEIPGQKFAVQVPRDVVFQARESLQELLSSRDNSDLCVPPTFDWGRQQFTDAMAARCKPAEAAPAAAP